MRQRSGFILMLLGLSLFAIAVAEQNYGAAWTGAFFIPASGWALLLLLDGANAALAGGSPLLDDPERFFGLCALSIPWWLLFECLNFRLQAWRYGGLAAPLPLRWASYALSSALVLPVLSETRQLLARVLPLQRLTLPPLRLNATARSLLRSAGAASLALPLLRPELFFPLVWVFAFLWLEPLLEREAPLESVLFQLGFGVIDIPLGWCAAGLLCGVAFEALDSYSGARQIYAAPAPGASQLFALPLAGYCAFALFALECSSLQAWARSRWARAGEFRRLWWVFLSAAFAAAAFIGLDRFSAVSFVPIP